MSKKYGVYICTGCGIEGALDLKALEELAGEEGANATILHPALCGPEGRAALLETVEKEILNGVRVAACSHRAGRCY